MKTWLITGCSWEVTLCGLLRQRWKSVWMRSASGKISAAGQTTDKGMVVERRGREWSMLRQKWWM